MRVLWLSNIEITSELRGTGSWIFAMANALVNTGTIQLYNITQGKVKNVTRQDYQSINQWLFPFESLRTNGLPGSKTILEIKSIVNDIKPDIIHIWGMENYWGLLTARGYIEGNIILEIQGLKFAIAKYFYSGLTLLDILKCFRLKEFLKPSVSLIGLKRSYTKWGKFEREMLMKHRIISTQSDWVRAYVKNVNPMIQVLNTSISLRTEFVEANKWEADSCIPYRIFTSNSPSNSYKGLHILFDAILILKNRFPQIRLCIAGSAISGLREGGYSKWLKRKINQLGLSENISWLGPLDAENIVLQMLKANVAVVPSFVESYCLSLDEALTVGVPTVISFSGAMPELAIHERTALFFPPGDVVMCANAIEKFFVNKEYAQIVSQNAFDENKAKKKLNLADLQISIYRSVL
jgi:glycosyltransferase involved in cell wall biosynthesis